MKKIYLKPELEITYVNAISTLCQSLVQNNDDPQNPGDVPPPAPGRKVF